MKNTLLTIVGPTAIGKTALSIKLAQHFQSEILSCDSRQFYKEMQIGTAVPEPEELAAVPHHFIQNRSILEDYNVGTFEKEALAQLNHLFQKNAIQLMVGGSGLYVDAVLKGLDYFPKVAPEIRKELNAQLNTKGLLYLQEQLKLLDLETYNTIALDNPQRVCRALEICLGTGKTYASFKNKPKAPRNFNALTIGLYAERALIYERINQRVLVMIEKGLLEEAKKLYPHKHLNALQTVGYKELFAYLEGTCSLDEAIAEIQKNTRRFAKRQLTWFRKDTHTLWFDYKTPIATIIANITEKINAF